MKLRALAMVVIAVALSVFTSSQTFATTTVPTTAKALSVVDVATTPAGWVPVAFGDAQVSVPAAWWVLYDSPPCPTGSPTGDVFVNPPPGLFACPLETAPAPSTTVSFGPPPSPLSTVLGHPEVINGILVYPYPTGPRSSYLVPSLGVEIAVDGPLGQRVLRTLTWSPRSVVLAPGSSPAIPSSWQQVTFAGLRFSAPTNWPITRTQVTPGLGAICKTLGVAFASTTVTLSTDVRPMLLPPCAYFPPTPQQPENGVQVDSGLRTEPMVTLSFSAHCLVLHGLTACPATSPAYSILVVRVNVPGRDKPVFFSIGLAGNGMVARAILYSLRAASPTRTIPKPTGIVTGVVQACVGVAVTAGEIRHVKVKVSLYSGSKRVASETVRSGAKYRFSVSPETYRLTGWWGSKDVTVRAGRTVTDNFWNLCV
ncbi:MAG: hypothetical protein ABSF89_17415 [Acidimicrobiales bacterium]